MSDSNIEKLVVELIEFQKSHFFGLYRAKVVSVDDPDKNGRIRVKIPSIYGDNISPWVNPSVPFAGKDHGMIFLPEEDDGVWISFEEGNISKPVWCGSWWASGEKPPIDDNYKSIVTSQGHRIILNDDKNEIKLVHDKGSEISLTNDNIIIKIGPTQIILSKTQGVDINNGALVIK